MECNSAHLLKYCTKYLRMYFTWVFPFSVALYFILYLILEATIALPKNLSGIYVLKYQNYK